MRVCTESAGVLAVDGVACTHNLLLHFKRHMYILRDTSRLFLPRKLLMLQVRSLAPCSSVTLMWHTCWHAIFRYACWFASFFFLLASFHHIGFFFLCGCSVVVTVVQKLLSLLRFKLVAPALTTHVRVLSRLIHQALFLTIAVCGPHVHSRF